jgi:hypothetical protein
MIRDLCAANLIHRVNDLDRSHRRLALMGGLKV